MSGQTEAPDEFGLILAYENGELDEDDVVVLFQLLVDNGHAWILQGHYGRTAQRLIQSGHVKLNSKKAR
jgi:hypothetical protein